MKGCLQFQCVFLSICCLLRTVQHDDEEYVCGWLEKDQSMLR